MDRRQTGAIAQLECEYFPDRKRLDLYLTPRDPDDRCAPELWNLEEKKFAFEEEFETEIKALVVPSAALLRHA